MTDTIVECPQCGGDGLDGAHDVERDGSKVVVECQYGSRMERKLVEQLDAEFEAETVATPTITFDNDEVGQTSQANVGDFTVDVETNTDGLVNAFMSGHLSSTNTWTSTND